MRSFRVIRVAASFLLALAAADSADAQSRLGAFTPWNAWWLHPTSSTLGINFDGTRIRIDRNGDGTNESTFVRPTGLQGIPDAAIGSLRLTPSRTIVYSFGGVCPGLGGTLVHFHRVPLSGDRLEPILTNLCIPRGIDRVGFYDTGRCDEPNGPGLGLDCTGRLNVSPQRIAYFATPSATFGSENFIWVDLNAGVASSAPAFDLENGLGFVHVSPSGTQAFIQHDLPVTGETDYRLVNLCPGSLGQVINAGGFPLLNQNGSRAAEVVSATGGEVEIEVSPTSPQVRFTLADCLTEVGACCNDQYGCIYDQWTPSICTLNGGTFAGPATTCSVCPPAVAIEACCFESGQPICSQLSNAACTAQGGAPQAGVAFCATDTCPTPEPVATMAGPTTASVGETVTYTIDYENEGGVTTPDVEIEINLPYGTEFEGATGGGIETDGRVLWTIGDLAPGAGGSVSFTFTIGCDAANQTAFLQGLISYPYTTEGNRAYLSTNNVLLEIAGGPSGDVGVAVVSTPAANPLLAGAEVEHAITLTNGNAFALSGVQIGSANSALPIPFTAGNAATFTRVVDAAGGTATLTSSGFEWTGDVPANGSRTIRVVTTVNACVPAFVEETSLAFGAPIAVFDQCNERLGESAEPQSFAIARTVDVEIAATNLPPPQNVRAPIIDLDVQVTRPGTTADVVVTLTSAAAAASPVTVSAFVNGMNVTTPPSVPGATWDPATRELEWSGSLPASGTIAIPFSGTVTACRAEIDLDGSSGPACASTPDLRANGAIAAVPEPPPGPWIASLGYQPHPFRPGNVEQHLVRIDPGPPATQTTMLCLPGEAPQGIGASPNGDVWVTWLPTYRVNPATLDFEAFDLDRLYDADLTSLSDVAVDPTNGAVFFSGGGNDMGSFVARIVRLDPAQGTITPYFSDSDYDLIQQLAADDQGSIAAMAYGSFGNVLGRIDPGAPNDLVVLYDPPSSSLADLTLDADGSYLVIDGTFGPSPVVYDVDADTGERTTVVASLNLPFPDQNGWSQLAVAPSGALLVAPYSGLGSIDRTTPDVGTTLLSFANPYGQLGDIAIVGAPEPSAAALAIAAGAVLATAGAAHGRRRQRRSAARSQADRSAGS